MPNEVELKLEIEPDCAGALRAHPLLAGEPERRVEQVSVYYDTPKGALRKAGYTLRVRRAGGRSTQTVKRAHGGAGLFDRPEWESEIEGDRPDRAALDETPLGILLTAKAERALEPVVTARVDRTIWMLKDGKDRLEMVLDEGTVVAGGDERPLCEAEIELKRGKREAALDLARLLGEELPLRIGVLTKAERGFALASGRLDKAAKAAPVALASDMDVADGFTAIAHACIRQFRLNEPLIAARRDPSALHQARVAMRRLRSSFSLFGSAIVDQAFPALREELRWFTARLGDARNLDVFLGGEGATPERREALEAARERAYTDVVEALGSRRFRKLMLDLVAWVETGAWRKGRKAKKPLADLAARRLDRRWEKVAEGAAGLDTLDGEQRHRLRIDIKKMRYALEFTTSLHRAAAPSGARFVKTLEAMQEALGHLNDLATARSLLRAIGEDEAAAPPDPAAERRHLAKTRKNFARLAEIGPFWRPA